nr:ATP-dependent helicase [uncultured Eisenbergiella sp.]
MHKPTENNDNNRGQIEAIRHGTGPLLVLAGPGSGKTFTIIQRILHLVENRGVDPSSILVITFTKAAAKEMKERFRAKTQGKQYPVNFGTFHAVYYHILKTSYPYRSGTVISDYEKKEIIKTILACPSCTCQNPEGPASTDEAIESLLAGISRFKNNGCHTQTGEPQIEEFISIFQAYEEELRRRGKLDFDDMVLKCHGLLTDRPDIRKAWQEKFRYILVDEFQDINPVQYAVLRILALPENNLFIVGDDDQSIYAFRGAKPEIMLGFLKDYPDAGKVQLEKNYRSTPEIIKSAGRLIAVNHNRYAKKNEAAAKGGQPVTCRGFASREEENEEIAMEIAKESNASVQALRETAIIYRTNQDACAMAGKLAEKGIPFRMKEKIKNPFRQRVPQDILAYLEFALGGQYRKDFYRIMNKPVRYISRNAVPGERVEFGELFSFYREKPYMKDVLRRLQMDMERIRRMDLFAAVNYIRKGMGYDDYLRKIEREEGKEKGAFLGEAEWMQRQMRNFASLEELADHILTCDKELEKAGRDPDTRDGVYILTMHASKGLEFNTVYIPDCNEGVIPHKKSMKGEAVEEERRMLYVAMTRARHKLTLSYVAGTKEEPGFPSRFLTELGR